MKLQPGWEADQASYSSTPVSTRQTWCTLLYCFIPWNESQTRSGLFSWTNFFYYLRCKVCSVSIMCRDSLLILWCYINRLLNYLLSSRCSRACCLLCHCVACVGRWMVCLVSCRQVGGNTIYNMLKLGDGETDANERPRYPHKIIKTKVYCVVIVSTFLFLSLLYRLWFWNTLKKLF